VFLVSIRKEKMENGITMKPDTYTSFGSYFRYLFHRYGRVPSQAFKNEIEYVVKGMSTKRQVTKAHAISPNTKHGLK
jgi:hypothetical protein